MGVDGSGWGKMGQVAGLEVDGDDRQCDGERYERSGGRWGHDSVVGWKRVDSRRC